ncbi:hypothetical protein GCM10027275_01420 [Rhabdobacter roseus]
MAVSLTSVFFVALLGAGRAHDYHVSVTQMQYNPAQKLWEISIRVFTDDLEKALSLANNNRRFEVLTNDQNDTYVETYLRRHFQVQGPDQQVKAFRYLGKEQEADATWIYVEVPFPGNPSGWSLQNNIFSEVFDDQVNMVNLKMAAQKKTLMFRKGQFHQPL